MATLLPLHAEDQNSLEIPVTLEDIKMERATSPEILSQAKYHHFVTGMEMRAVSWAKACVLGAAQINQKVEAFIQKRKNKPDTEPTGEATWMTDELRDMRFALRKKYSVGEYWLHLHDGKIPDEDLIWLRFFDYADVYHPTDATLLADSRPVPNASLLVAMARKASRERPATIRTPFRKHYYNWAQ
jgi:hypothetical protein